MADYDEIENLFENGDEEEDDTYKKIITGVIPTSTIKNVKNVVNTIKNIQTKTDIPTWKLNIYTYLILFFLYILFANIITDNLFARIEFFKSEGSRLIFQGICFIILFILIKKIFL